MKNAQHNLEGIQKSKNHHLNGQYGSQLQPYNFLPGYKFPPPVNHPYYTFPQPPLYCCNHPNPYGVNNQGTPYIDRPIEKLLNDLHELEKDLHALKLERKPTTDQSKQNAQTGKPVDFGVLPQYPSHIERLSEHIPKAQQLLPQNPALVPGQSINDDQTNPLEAQTLPNQSQEQSISQHQNPREILPGQLNIKQLTPATSTTTPTASTEPDNNETATAIAAPAVSAQQQNYPQRPRYPGRWRPVYRPVRRYPKRYPVRRIYGRK